MSPSSYVEIPRPYLQCPNRFDVELAFPAASKARAEQHQRLAWELARIHDVEARTPYKVNPRWSIYEENWGNGQRHGWLNHRRLEVHGTPRALARYLAALNHVLTSIERLATRAARAFGCWRRSLLAQVSGHLDYEDPTTLRIRAKDFRAAALRHLTGFLAQGAPHPGHRDNSRPLWEQAAAVASEVWHETGGIDPWAVPEEDVEQQLARMDHTDLSIVDQQPAAPEPQADAVPVLPDTVEEFLVMSGPAHQAPREHVPAERPGAESGPGTLIGAWQLALQLPGELSRRPSVTVPPNPPHPDTPPARQDRQPAREVVAAGAPPDSDGRASQALVVLLGPRAAEDLPVPIR
ncbi:hypothetical protein QMK19_39085 [Streptomyces sp. H10-C2]|uniref:hypothetical protein n=1 Tax=unclassified Streptomyces TaxID=2593676 RepID=UPI0024BB8FDE|nr:MULTISPECIES: hypothetical protein [unclassified Streptomyces]MDJ0347211.1 hypothetical protein [Streptomyces sp. PH10-H1]MDJ0375441.1 hypothetical protein [Streptomyces sp. H10-C2]